MAPNSKVQFCERIIFNLKMSAKAYVRQCQKWEKVDVQTKEFTYFRILATSISYYFIYNVDVEIHHIVRLRWARKSKYSVKFVYSYKKPKNSNF